MTGDYRSSRAVLRALRLVQRGVAIAGRHAGQPVPDLAGASFERINIRTLRVLRRQRLVSVRLCRGPRDGEPYYYLSLTSHGLAVLHRLDSRYIAPE